MLFASCLFRTVLLLFLWWSLVLLWPLALDLVDLVRAGRSSCCLHNDRRVHPCETPHGSSPTTAVASPPPQQLNEEELSDASDDVRQRRSRSRTLSLPLV